MLWIFQLIREVLVLRILMWLWYLLFYRLNSRVASGLSQYVNRSFFDLFPIARVLVAFRVILAYELCAHLCRNLLPTVLSE